MAASTSPSLDFSDAGDLFKLGGDVKLSSKADWPEWSEAVELCLTVIGYDHTVRYGIKDETKLAIFILQTIKGDARLLVKGLTKGSDILNRFRTTYEATDTMAGMLAFEKLGKLKLDTRKGLDDYVLKFRNLYSEVKKARYPVPLLSIAHMFIVGAGAARQHHIATWAHVEAKALEDKAEVTDIDLAKLYESLATAGRVQQALGAPITLPASGGPPAANKTGLSQDKSIPSGSGSKDRKDMYCLYCGKKGHFAKDCRKRAADMKKGSDGKWRFKMENGTPVKLETNAASGSKTLSVAPSGTPGGQVAEEDENNRRANDYAGTFNVSAHDRQWFFEYAKRHLTNNVTRAMSATVPAAAPPRTILKQSASHAKPTKSGYKCSFTPPTPPSVPSGPRGWWLFDTGSDCHLTNDVRDYVSSVPLPSNCPTISTGGGPIRPTRIGHAEPKLDLEGSCQRILLTNVLLVEHLPLKVFSGEVFFAHGGTIDKHTLISPQGRPLTSLNLPVSGFFLHEFGKPVPKKYGQEKHVHFDMFTTSEMTTPAGSPLVLTIEPEISITPGASTDAGGVPQDFVAAGSNAGEDPASMFCSAAGPSVVGPAEICCPHDLHSHLAKLSTDESSRLWHRRLGHPGADALCKTLPMVKGIDLSPSTFENRPCDTCDLTKSLRHRSQRHFPRATNILEVVHLDTFVVKPTTIEGYTIGAYLIDDYSRYRQVVFAKKKEQISARVIEALLRLETTTGLNVVSLHCDQGREFLKVFSWAKERGTAVVESAPYTPEENPVAERTIAIVNQKISTMLRQGGLPQFLADYVGEHAVLLTNCTATSALKDKTPHECFYDAFKPGEPGKNKPDLSMLRTLGCKTFVNITHHPQTSELGKRQGRKWDAKAVQGKLVGWEYASHNYFVYIPAIRKVIKSPHVVFHEDMNDPADDENVLRSTPPWVEELTGGRRRQSSRPPSPSTAATTPELTPVSPPVACLATSSSDILDLADPVPEMNLGGGCVLEFIADWEVYATITETDPKTVAEALESPHADDWREAINAEIQQLLDMGIFEFVKLGEKTSRSSLTAKWVFKEKKDTAGGEVYRRKARLVARGFQQRQGVDYQEVFATTAAASSVRLLLALATKHSLHLAGGDVKGAHLVGDLLDEKIYMRQFPCLRNFFRSRPMLANKHGYFPDAIIRLLRPLYGLKQAGRVWQRRLKKEMANLPTPLFPTISDDAVYTNKHKTLIVLTHVDDLLAAGQSSRLCDEFFQELGRTLEVYSTDADSYLGMRIQQRHDSLVVDQSVYTKSMLGDAPMRRVSTPITPTAVAEAVANPGRATAEATHAYQQMIGQMIYPSTRTRPDIAFASGLWAKYMSNPSPMHAKEATRVLRYLNQFPSLALRYKKGNSSLVGYVDAAFDNQEGSKSTSGWVFMLAGGPVSWSSKRQSVVAHSSTEAEYYALGAAAREAAWLRELLEELGFPVEGAVKIHEDNTACMKVANNTVSTTATRMKHIRRCNHYIRDEIEAGRIQVIWIPSEEQAADGLTKALEKSSFEKFVSMLGLINAE